MTSVRQTRDRISGWMFIIGGLSLGCGGTGDGPLATSPSLPTPPASAITSVSVSPTNASLQIGDTTRLVATVSGTGGFSSAINWSSDDQAKATVSTVGLVQARAAGTTTIRATSAPDPSKSATAVVTVNLPVVTVTPSSIRIGGNGIAMLTATVNGFPNAAISWSTSDAGIASVTAAGVVTPHATGNATITARHSSGAFGTCAVTVVQANPTISLVSLNSNGAAANLSALKGIVDVTMDLNPAGLTISRVDLLMGTQVVASQVFPGGAASPPAVGATTALGSSLTMSFDSGKVPNGTYVLSANMYLKEQAPAATTSLTVTIKN